MIAEWLQAIVNILPGILDFIIGPYGALIISILLNIVTCSAIVYMARAFLSEQRIKDNQLKEKDIQITDLIEDMKILLIKAQLSNDEIKKIIEVNLTEESSEE